MAMHIKRRKKKKSNVYRFDHRHTNEKETAEIIIDSIKHGVGVGGGREGEREEEAEQSGREREEDKGKRRKESSQFGQLAQTTSSGSGKTGETRVT